MAAVKVIRQIDDTQIPIAMTLKRPNGDVVNLTGMTVKFAMFTTDGVTKLAATAATIVLATAGTVEYDFQAADVATAGTFYAYFITTDGGEEDTFPVKSGDLSVIVQDTTVADVIIEASYPTLVRRVGHQLFGIRSGHVPDQLSDIEDCIKDGLHDVYAAHSWSFFRPIKSITTTAPYDTGTITVASGVVTLAGVGVEWPTWAAVCVLKVDNEYYDVDTRTDVTTITLEDLTADVDAGTSYELGRPEYDLPTAFEAIIGKELAYEAGQSDFYPTVKERHDDTIRRFRQDNPYHDRPLYFSTRTVEFDPTVGSRRRLALYPTPDAAYVLKVPMKLRATMIDATNLYPVGGESLTQVITEACLAAAERNLDEQEGVHTKRFLELLPLAIQADLEMTSPTSLGPDAPRGESTISRSVRMGDVTLDGDTL